MDADVGRKNGDGNLYRHQLANAEARLLEQKRRRQEIVDSYTSLEEMPWKSATVFTKSLMVVKSLSLRCMAMEAGNYVLTGIMLGEDPPMRRQ